MKKIIIISVIIGIIIIGSAVLINSNQETVEEKWLREQVSSGPFTIDKSELETLKAYDTHFEGNLSILATQIILEQIRKEQNPKQLSEAEKDPIGWYLRYEAQLNKESK